MLQLWWAGTCNQVVTVYLFVYCFCKRFKTPAFQAGSIQLAVVFCYFSKGNGYWLSFHKTQSTGQKQWQFRASGKQSPTGETGRLLKAGVSVIDEGLPCCELCWYGNRLKPVSLDFQSAKLNPPACSRWLFSFLSQQNYWLTRGIVVDLMNLTLGTVTDGHPQGGAPTAVLGQQQLFLIRHLLFL